MAWERTPARVIARAGRGGEAATLNSGADVK